jgi:hypothetical protein
VILFAEGCRDAEPLFAAEREYLSEVGLHRVSVSVRKVEPSLEKLVWLRLSHRFKVQIGEQPSALEVLREQPIGDLAKEVSSRVLRRHGAPPSKRP